MTTLKKNMEYHNYRYRYTDGSLCSLSDGLAPYRI